MRALRVSFAVLGVALFVAGAGLAVSNATQTTTYGGRSTGFAVLELAAGAALLGGAVVLLAEPGWEILGALTVLLEAIWFAPAVAGWDGGPSGLRSAGLAAAPLGAGVVLTMAALIATRRRKLRALAVPVALALTTAAVALVLARDPLRDLYCWSDCTVAPLVAGQHFGLTHRLTSLVLGLEVVAGALAAVVGLAGLPAARRGTRSALAAASLTGIVLAAYAVALRLEPQESPRRELYGTLFAARALALVAFGAALAWLALQPRLVRARVTALALDLERSTAAGDLAERLAQTLGDPSLRLGYPVGPANRVVDSRGAAVVFDRGRRVTPVVGEAGIVALIESDALTVEALERSSAPRRSSRSATSGSELRRSRVSVT